MTNARLPHPGAGHSHALAKGGAAPHLPEPRSLSPYAQRVLDAVSRVPRGCVFTYGDVAEWLGESSPRAVGTVLFRYGSDVPWWRIVLSDGRPAPVQGGAAVELLQAEGVPFRAGRVDLAQARWSGG